MKVRDIVDTLGLSVLSAPEGLDNEVVDCYVCDLLSDVMGNADAGHAWVTLQTHKNVAAIASLKEVACVIVVKGFSVPDDTLQMSKEDGIPFLSTTMETFDVAGKLYQLLKK